MRISSKWLAVLAAATLAACAFPTINEKMASFVGQPVNALVARLGYPTREDHVGGRKVYVWTTGNVAEYTCTIRAILDDRDVIATWDAVGNEGGCANYAGALGK